MKKFFILFLVANVYCLYSSQKTNFDLIRAINVKPKTTFENVRPTLKELVAFESFLIILKQAIQNDEFNVKIKSKNNNEFKKLQITTYPLNHTLQQDSSITITYMVHNTQNLENFINESIWDLVDKQDITQEINNICSKQPKIQEICHVKTTACFKNPAISNETDNEVDDKTSISPEPVRQNEIAFSRVYNQNYKTKSIISNNNSIYSSPTLKSHNCPCNDNTFSAIRRDRE